MKKLLPLLRHTVITTLVFVLLAAVLLGLLANYGAGDEFGQHRTLTGSVLHILWPLLLFGIYLPFLLLYPLRQLHKSGIEQPKRRLLFFLRACIVLGLLNPVVLLWIYSLFTHGYFSWTTALLTILLLLAAAVVAVIAGFRGFLFGRETSAG